MSWGAINRTYFLAHCGSPQRTIVRECCCIMSGVTCRSHDRGAICACQQGLPQVMNLSTWNKRWQDCCGCWQHHVSQGNYLGSRSHELRENDWNSYVAEKQYVFLRKKGHFIGIYFFMCGCTKWRNDGLSCSKLKSHEDNIVETLQRSVSMAVSVHSFSSLCSCTWC